MNAGERASKICKGCIAIGWWRSCTREVRERRRQGSVLDRGCWRMRWVERECTRGSSNAPYFDGLLTLRSIAWNANDERYLRTGSNNNTCHYTESY